MFPLVWYNTEYWLIPKIEKATLCNRRDMSTLGFAWIPEFIGARYVFVLLVCHAERSLGWNYFKLCQRMSWDSKSKSLLEVSIMEVMKRDTAWEVGQSLKKP